MTTRIRKSGKRKKKIENALSGLILGDFEKNQMEFMPIFFRILEDRGVKDIHWISKPSSELYRIELFKITDYVIINFSEYNKRKSFLNKFPDDLRKKITIFTSVEKSRLVHGFTCLSYDEELKTAILSEVLRLD